MINKKNLPHFITVVSFVFFIVLGLACASSPGTSASSPGASAETSAVRADANSPGMDLDAAIKEAAMQTEENLPGETKVALVSVASSSAQLSEYIINTLESALVGGKKLVVVDRANLDKIRAEQGFQMSGEVDDDSAKNIGKLLGAGAIITGAFTDLGDVYRLNIKAINIETATIAVSYPADIARSTRIETLLASGGGAAGTGRQAAAGAQPAYKIGDTGPAGGLIFYDKGNNSGGWRYLEAASYDLEKTGWGQETGALKTGIGSGKQNTQNIRGRAAMLCLQHDQGEQRDWYLPSKDELDLMFMNLKIKGLGDFSDSTYWSSSTDNAISAGGQVWIHNFGDGSQYTSSIFSVMTGNHLVRPIRQF